MPCTQSWKENNKSKWPTVLSDVSNGSFTMAMFVSKTIIDSDIWQSCNCTYLCHLRWCDTDRIISIWIVLPKVAKASSIVTVEFRWHWHFCLKMSPIETRLKWQYEQNLKKHRWYIFERCDQSKKSFRDITYTLAY